MCNGRMSYTVVDTTIYRISGSLHLSLLLGRLLADGLVLLDPVLGKVPATVGALLQVVPGLGGEEGAARAGAVGGSGGLGRTLRQREWEWN